MINYILPKKIQNKIYGTNVCKKRLNYDKFIKLIKYFSTMVISPTGNYMFKVNNRNTGTRCEICSELTIKTPCSSGSIVDFEQVNAGCVRAEAAILICFIELLI